jgi:hypothetical protein
MPIVPCFDPSTGASGGPAAGGGAAALPDWRVVDVTDGSWTSSDPGGNARVSSVVMSGDEATVTWDGFTATADDAIDGSAFNGQRYYQALTYDDGTPVSLSDDGFTVEWWADTPAVAGCARTQFALGISSDPTATTNSVINFSGLYWTPDRADGVPYIGQVRTNASPLTAFNLLNQYGYGRTAFVSGSPGLSFGWAIKSDGTSTGYNNRSMTSYTGTVYLQISMGAPSTRVISAGQTNVFAAYYRVLRTPLGPTGHAP